MSLEHWHLCFVIFLKLGPQKQAAQISGLVLKSVVYVDPIPEVHAFGQTSLYFILSKDMY